MVSLIKKTNAATEQQVPPELVAFAEQAGRFIEYWGFKNIQGQIWAYLYLSEVPLDTAELMRRTGISKGLASIYLKEMLSYDVIHEARKGLHGTTFYQANPNQDEVIFNVLRKRERMMMAQVQAAWEQCCSIPENEMKSAKISKKGLEKSGDLIRHATTVMDVFIRSCETMHSISNKIKKAFRGEKYEK